MQDKDVRLNFMFEDKPVRGEIVRLTESYQTILNQKSYSEPVKKLLGEALASVALLNGISKHEGRIILQFQGSGFLKLLSVHCSNDDHLRALVQTDIDKTAIENPFQEGQMVLFYEPDNKGNRYQSIIEIVSENIAQNMEHYFNQSEQVETRIWISQTKDSVSAFMLQLLPDTSDQKGITWEHITTIAATLTDEELSTLSFQEILRRLFHEEDLRIFDPDVMRFGCACSKSKMESAIITTGKEEVERILSEHDSIDVTCEYCGNEYSFDRVDVSCLFDGGCSDASDEIQH